VIGTGLPSVNAPGLSSILESSATGTGTPGQRSGNGEPGGTSLFGAKDVGSRFVYVIDRSWSMEGDAIHVVPLSAAKSELTASIQRLDERQQFQIIFYNEQPFVLVNDNGRFDYFFGTDSQRLDAVRQLRSVQPSGGTNHVPALEKALDLAPDVVFFLTDGEEPSLNDRDIRRLAQRGRGARIHCIQFGKEPESAMGNDPGNWLRKLAAATDGTYVYRDVTRLGR
jgi:Ca-activated chloride channel family protein